MCRCVEIIYIQLYYKYIHIMYTIIRLDYIIKLERGISMYVCGVY